MPEEHGRFLKFQRICFSLAVVVVFEVFPGYGDCGGDCGNSDLQYGGSQWDPSIKSAQVSCDYVTVYLVYEHGYWRTREVHVQTSRTWG